jgi:hypothetical protein
VSELLLGSQVPTFRHAPEYVSTSGPEAVRLARVAGLDLDPWQQDALADILGEGPTGRWAAFEAAVLVARQNGKGGIFEARVLAGLFLLRERLIMYSAHEFKTAAEMFRRIEALIDGTPSMRRRVKAVTRSKGEEGIELLPTKRTPAGQRLRFMARSKSSGRGFTGDCNILDEAQNLPDAAVDALMPTMSAVPNPQLLYGLSAPDKDIAPAEHMARVRRRALKGGADRLVWLEWAAELCSDECRPGCDQHDDPADPRVWAKTNPAMGRRIAQDFIAGEHESMGAKGFARERLSVGNWPVDADAQWLVIAEKTWRRLADVGSSAEGRVAFAIDTTPDGAYTAIVAYGLRADGLGHIEVIEHRRGSSWVVARMLALRERWDPLATVVDAGAPAGALIADLEAAGIDVTKPAARDVAAACGSLVTATGAREGDDPTIRYVPHPALDAAVAGAEKRPLADAWKWSRRSASVDVSPLIAATMARWGFVTYEEEDDDVEPWVMIR